MWRARPAVVGFSRMSAAERNMPRQVFLEPAARELYPDWAAVAAETVAYLRLDAGLHPDDRRLATLVGELSLKSEDFRRLWADHQVKSKAHGVKRVAHPLVGELVFPYETLGAAGDPDQCLVVCTPEPGGETAERVALPAGRAAAPSAPAG
ncbi:hypothetical protein GCM10010433_71990 [Streptomyces pulveraceus]|uniref:MmyB-like transcription regulator ligand binding domain-containing protein n=1 Tax=Streptomyces pulveraceus TaxID=68258 RepID=A0ABW1GEE3_9ACTN